MNRDAFLPVNRADMERRGWSELDVLLVTGDAYVDHPSFGAPVIGRVLEAEGFRVGLLAQPNVKDKHCYEGMGRPRLCAMVTSGNLDSMVAHYTAAKRKRSRDFYSPGGQMGLRPDRAVIVYAQGLKKAFPDLPVGLGGLEASLRRFAHYDYWDDAVRPSILLDADADWLVYGMGERASVDIVRRLSEGTLRESLPEIRGVAWRTNPETFAPTEAVLYCPDFEAVRADKKTYARATRLQHEQHDAVRGLTLVQPSGDELVVVNRPQPPLSTPELDDVAELPYVRAPHPDYDAAGGVPGIEEVRFSLIHNRGCFGNCHFCSLAYHQGRSIATRSIESLVREAKAIIALPDFKGYIHDVGGPTANFRHNACTRQETRGVCRNRSCLTPEPCPNLDADHGDFLDMLRALRALPGVKKVFVRSGLRYDYLLREPTGQVLPELIEHHISGQLKVAPEHCVDGVLDLMGKPRYENYQKFTQVYEALNRKKGKKQYLVPYLISSHPGCTLSDAVTLAETLNRRGVMPEQVQDFYPTPGTLSTCMYHTGLNPMTMEPVHVPRSHEEKAMQRALLQWRRPENAQLVRAALHKAGRRDLIGQGRGALVSPATGSRGAK